VKSAVFKPPLVALAASLLAGSAYAGPFIFAGTDADDHGSATATANQEGWLFMQKALENLATSSSLTSTNKVVVSLGSESSALDAATSAFQKSNLPGLGWTFQSVPTLTGASFTSALGVAGIVMLDSGVNVGGGLTSAEETVLTANASALNSFVGGGGGLFSQAGEYGWLSALVPGLATNDTSDTGLALTASGTAAFPGLTNADLSAGPWHLNFQNVGSIPVLATGVGSSSGLNVIIGSSGGSITNPNPTVAAIPEPETFALMLGGLALLGAIARRRTLR